MSQKKILVFEIVLCLFVLISIYLVSHLIYADVFKLRFFITLLGNWIIVTIINWKREVNTDRPKPRWLTFLLIFVVIIVFIAHKPAFSYNQGKNIIAQHGYDNVYELQDKSIIAFRLKHTRFVPYAYLYAGEKDNIKYYILLSPINGDIEAERIGDGNYLDIYFRMRYRQ